VSPETPSPNIYPENILYFHMSSNPGDRQGLFIKAGRQVNAAVLSVVWNRPGKLELELDRPVESIAGTLWRVRPQRLRDAEQFSRRRWLADTVLNENR
jgi:hypothetical protein